MSTIATRAWKNLYEQYRWFIWVWAITSVLVLVILAGKPRHEQFKITASNWTLQYRKEHLVRLAGGHTEWQGSVVHRCDGTGIDIRCSAPVIPLPVGGEHSLHEYFYGTVTFQRGGTKTNIKYDDWKLYKQEVEQGYIPHACWWGLCWH